MKHLITILNPVEAVIDVALEALVKPSLSYKTALYVPGIHHKRRIESDKSVLRKCKGGFLFYAGLVDHVKAFCKEKNIDVTVEDQSIEHYEMYDPYLPGITFRPDDQVPLINSWLDKPRGIIKSPTGSGKTVLGFGCLSAFEDVCIIWLCHTKQLMTDTRNDAIKKYGWKEKDIGMIGAGFNETGRKLTIATRQSFKKIAEELSDLYDVVVVDEVHHISALDGEYSYILSRLLAPFRLGLTASPLKEGLPTFAAIGLIGPIVGELTLNQASDLGILAIPKIQIVKIPVSHTVKNLRKYSDVYSDGIVNRLELNQNIALIAKKHADIGETALIMVTQLAHGDNIKEALRVIGINAILIEGASDTAKREKTKQDLDNKLINVVICSGVWKEGVNIPSLDAVILACGGKDPLQALGRGMRKTKDKDTLWYYDFFDQSHHYLVSHFGERLCFYLQQGWL